MIKLRDIKNIEKVINNKKIIYSKLLSNSFGINCIKISLEDNKSFVVKYYNDKVYSFNSIKTESENLNFFYNINLKFFPKVEFQSDDYLVISFLKNDNLKPNRIREDLLNSIISIHWRFKAKK